MLAEGIRAYNKIGDDPIWTWDHYEWVVKCTFQVMMKNIQEVTI